MEDKCKVEDCTNKVYRGNDGVVSYYCEKHMLEYPNMKPIKKFKITIWDIVSIIIFMLILAVLFYIRPTSQL